MSCLEGLYKSLRASVVQSRARASYRLNRWKAARVRHKWMKRETAYRKELKLILNTSSPCCCDDDDSLSRPEAFLSIPVFNDSQRKDKHKYCGLSRFSSQEEERNYRNTALSKFDSVVDYEEGVSVLSPQRLTERLSENALARQAVGESDAELAQYLKDERIALFLQNDEFITELRSNQDFMSALQREHDGDSEPEEEYECDDSQNYLGGRLNSRRGEGGGEMIPSPLDDATFKERLATMGKASRKKFAQIAKVFSRGKRSAGGARSLLPSVGGSASANGKDLLMSSDPLIDEYDEERVQASSEPVMSSLARNP